VATTAPCGSCRPEGLPSKDQSAGTKRPTPRYAGRLMFQARSARGACVEHAGASPRGKQRRPFGFAQDKQAAALHTVAQYPLMLPVGRRRREGMRGSEGRSKQRPYRRTCGCASLCGELAPPTPGSSGAANQVRLMSWLEATTYKDSRLSHRL